MSRAFTELVPFLKSNKESLEPDSVNKVVKLKGRSHKKNRFAYGNRSRPAS